jgi:hypothetical protein
VTLLTWIQAGVCSNHDWDTDNTGRGISWFYSGPADECEIVPQIRPQPFPSISDSINYLLFIVSLDAMRRNSVLLY